jgi:hypothetical protein
VPLTILFNLTVIPVSRHLPSTHLTDVDEALSCCRRRRDRDPDLQEAYSQTHPLIRARARSPECRSLVMRVRPAQRSSKRQSCLGLTALAMMTPPHDRSHPKLFLRRRSLEEKIPHNRLPLIFRHSSSILLSPNQHLSSLLIPPSLSYLVSFVLPFNCASLRLCFPLVVFPPPPAYLVL